MPQSTWCTCCTYSNLRSVNDINNNLTYKRCHVRLSVGLSVYGRYGRPNVWADQDSKKWQPIAILDFGGSEIWRYFCFRDVGFNLWAKFYANICNSDWVMTVKVNIQNGGRRHFEFTSGVDFFSYGRFWIVASSCKISLIYFIWRLSYWGVSKNSKWRLSAILNYFRLCWSTHEVYLLTRCLYSNFISIRFTFRRYLRSNISQFWLWPQNLRSRGFWPPSITFRVAPDFGSGSGKSETGIFPNPAKSGSGQISSRIWPDLADASAANKADLSSDVCRCGLKINDKVNFVK